MATEQSERGPRPAMELLWAAPAGAQAPSGTASRVGSSVGPGDAPRVGLSVDRIVEAAIGVADRGGVGALSMARIATELGFTTMSLYRHVASKDDLLVLMVDAASADPPDLSAAADWRAGLEQWAWERLVDLRRHPWVLDVPISGPPMTPKGLGWMDSGLRTLVATDLEEGEKVGVLLLVTGYVMTAARFAVEMPPVDPGVGSDGTTFGPVLARVVDAERFPALSRAVESGLFDEGDDGYTDEDFDFGLQRVLDGVGVLVEPRASR